MYNPWWEGEHEPPGIPRKNYTEAIRAAFSSQNIVMVHGLRRVGKTTILHQYIAGEIGTVGPRRVFFVSMDHPELGKSSILDILRECRRMNSAGRKEPSLLVLDEVHARKGFERELKVLADTEKNLRVLASGSSSLRIRHDTPAMTGRYNRLEVRPLSFREYLDFTGRTLDPREPQLMEAFADAYLDHGGMPQYVLTGDPQMLVNLVDDVIYKDIAGQYGVSDPRLLADLFFLLMERSGRSMSYSKLGRIMGVGVDTAKRYVGHFQEAGLLQLVEMDGPPNVRKYSPRKCYAPDTGIRRVMVGRASRGALAENAVLLNLPGQAGEVRYHLGPGGEVDFVTGDMAVEVKYRDSVGPEEIRTLASLQRRGLRKRIVVTRRRCDIPAGGVDSIPLWALLSGLE